jgi:hypothetical protein
MPSLAHAGDGGVMTTPEVGGAFAGRGLRAAVGRKLAGPARTVRRRSGVAQIAAHTLDSLAQGRLSDLPVTIRFWDGSSLPCGSSGDRPVVVVRKPRALAHLLRRPGELGLARAWVDGSLTVDGDLGDVLPLRREFVDVTLSAQERIRLALAAVRAAGPGVLRKPPIPSIEMLSQRHAAFTCTRPRAVRHHYDVSHDFYRFVLGPSMVYSCAYFSARDDTLEEAQERKLDLICRKLALAPGERFLAQPHPRDWAVRRRSS